ncbi:hypothetical protein OIU74_029757 [Salix koriyanagi]|uniref:Uncharacterized protein n=1 Tax=Salix koriyanagi TaxID=2511006 RepID=A0A9Q0VEL3_9ROSI|nr:hypothetical protein OIU74_029757 [Salix koriyanagi]
MFTAVLHCSSTFLRDILILVYLGRKKIISNAFEDNEITLDFDSFPDGIYSCLLNSIGNERKRTRTKVNSLWIEIPWSFLQFQLGSDDLLIRNMNACGEGFVHRTIDEPEVIGTVTWWINFGRTDGKYIGCIWHLSWFCLLFLA